MFNSREPWLSWWLWKDLRPRPPPPPSLPHSILTSVLFFEGYVSHQKRNYHPARYILGDPGADWRNTRKSKWAGKRRRKKTSGVHGLLAYWDFSTPTFSSLFRFSRALQGTGCQIGKVSALFIFLLQWCIRFFWQWRGKTITTNT